MVNKTGWGLGFSDEGVRRPRVTDVVPEPFGDTSSRIITLTSVRFERILVVDNSHRNHFHKHAMHFCCLFSMTSQSRQMVAFLILSLFAVPTLGFRAATRGPDLRRVHAREFPSTQGKTPIALHTTGKNFDDETRKGKKKKRPSISTEVGFAVGDELKRLRNDLEILRDTLQWAEAIDDHSRILDLTNAIRDGERRDPDIAYAEALQDIAETKAALGLSKEDKDAILLRLQGRAQAARSLLPRFRMEGLWIGNYGEPSGDVLINVTYVGDTMLAAKVTGEENVPRGEVTFTVDLTPRIDSLEPLKLRVGPTSQATTNLPRFAGRGQVAKRGFEGHKFVEGQLVMFERHFSFVWVPIRHHVLFRRPTPEQTLTLLRDHLAKEDELENAREYLHRCFQMDMTDALASQASFKREDYFYGQDPLRRISTVADLEGMDRQLTGMEKESWFHRNPFWNAINFLADGLLDKTKNKPVSPGRSDLEKA